MEEDDTKINVNTNSNETDTTTAAEEVKVEEIKIKRKNFKIPNDGSSSLRLQSLPSRLTDKKDLFSKYNELNLPPINANKKNSKFS